MDIFKNKYYKVFPLSIFITQCTDSEEEETVEFEDEDQLNIYKSFICFNKKKKYFRRKR